MNEVEDRKVNSRKCSFENHVNRRRREICPRINCTKSVSLFNQETWSLKLAKVLRKLVLLSWYRVQAVVKK